MNKRIKRKIEKLVFILVILAVGYFYNTYINTEEKEEISTVELRKNEAIEEAININENDTFKIYFVDVGQADCILINNNGEYALIDAGNNEDGKKLVDYFASLGIENFKYVIGTHAHEDHIGGMDDVIENFNIEHFFMPDVITTTKTFEEVLDALEEKQIAFETPEIDSTFSLADTKFNVLHVGTDKTDLNNTSIVLKVTYKNTSYLLMGDATSVVEKEILNKDLKSDVLKVGHHGSQYSTTASFLKAVNPKYAVIQVGENNTYNHPKDITINKLEKIGTKIYRTDKDGTIILTSDGQNITIDTVTTDTNNR